MLKYFLQGCDTTDPDSWQTAIKSGQVKVILARMQQEMPKSSQTIDFQAFLRLICELRENAAMPVKSAVS